MAFRDRLEKLKSYVGIDDFGEEEEVLLDSPDSTASVESQVRERVVNDAISNPNRPTAPKTKPIRQRPEVTERRPDTGHLEDSTSHTFSLFREETARQEGPRFPERPQAPTSRPNQQASRHATKDVTQQHQNVQSGQTQIAIKHPLRYEDTEALAEAFLLGQCILVDFEYMQDAQARRCIDFLTGACLVAKGTLQRVGATMFLLTPQGVVVTKEDALPQQGGQELTYDYDLKRR